MQTETCQASCMNQSTLHTSMWQLAGSFGATLMRCQSTSRCSLWIGWAQGCQVRCCGHCVADIVSMCVCTCAADRSVAQLGKSGNCFAQHLAEVELLQRDTGRPKFHARSRQETEDFFLSSLNTWQAKQVGLLKWCSKTWLSAVSLLCMAG